MSTMRLCIGDPLNRWFKWFKWYDAEEGSAELWANIRKDAPSHIEEFIIVDHEYFNPVNPLTLGITKAADFAYFLAGLSDHKATGIPLYMSIIGDQYAAKMVYEDDEEVCYTRYDFDELEDAFDEAYRGYYNSKAEMAEQLYGEPGYLTGEDAKRLTPYVDWEAVARDLSQDINFVESDGGVYAFWNH